MRTLAIGDIHGCIRAFDALLAEIDLQPDDVLVTLGDYVDRGPDSRGVLERMASLASRCCMVPLIGNHELMMLDARRAAEHFALWMDVGGKQTLESYCAEMDWQSFAQAVPDRHWRFLGEECRHYYETDTHIFVHAAVDPELPLDQQPEETLCWGSLEPRDGPMHVSQKTIVVGHTIQRSGRPLAREDMLCIDTWVYGGGWLTCLDVEAKVCWQANEQGQTRVRNLQFRGC